LNCREIGRNVKRVASTTNGIWMTRYDDGDLTFTELIKSPTRPGVYIINQNQDFSVQLKDVRSTLYGDVIWGILKNGTLVKHDGLTNVRPFGSLNNWVVYMLTGNKLHDHDNGIVVETNTGQFIGEKGRISIGLVV